MKKTFSLEDDKKTPERVADQIKHEIKKYIKRERNKKLPDAVDFWDFDCRFGKTQTEAVEIHFTKINEHIEKVIQDKNDSFYLEILSKPAIRSK